MLPLFLEIFFVLIALSNSISFEYFNGYQVKELTSTTGQLFILEAQPWNVAMLTNTDKTSSCNSSLLLGGYGIMQTGGYLERVYSSLPIHNVIYYQIEFFLLDDWQPTDELLIYFDEIDITSRNRVVFRSDRFPSNACGSNTNDLTQFTLVGKSSHNNNNFTLNIRSSLNINIPRLIRPSFGIRDISLIFADVSDQVQSKNCFQLSNNGSISGSGLQLCDCGIGTYLETQNGRTCLACDESCSNCFGPSAAECYDCKPGYSFIQNECVKCHSSCNTCTGPNPDQCVTCKSGLWLYWNNTCLATCSSPPQAQVIVDDFKICRIPCSSSLDIMHWNQTCVSSCEFPLKEQIVRDNKLCQKPCKDGEFLYPNNYCLPTCSSPYITKTLENIRLCEYPCNFTDNQFLFPDGSCVNTCSPPFSQRIENGFRFCDPKINTEEKGQVKQISNTLTVTGNVVSVGAITASIVSSSSSSISLACLAKMLYYIRYMTINYPEKLEYLLMDQNSSSISLNFGPKMPEPIEDLFPRYPLSSKFDYYNLHSSFLVNFGDAISTLTIILIVIIFSSFMTNITANYKQQHLHLLFLRIKNLTRWDLFLIILCTNYDGVAFYSSLEIRSIDYFDFWSPYVSLMSCIFINIIIIFILFQIFSLVLKHRKQKLNAVMPEFPQQTLQVEHEPFELLVRSFRDRSFLQKSYMLFFLIRIYIFDVIIGYLFKYPLPQAILITIMSVLMLIYLITQRPYKEKSDLIESMTNELILFIVNLNVLILAILDQAEAEAFGTRASCGEVIIACNVAFNILALVFLGFEISLGLIKAYKIIKTSKDKSGWMKIFLILFEKDGMTLEGRDLHDPKILSSPNQKLVESQAKAKYDLKLPINDNFESPKNEGSKLPLSLSSSFVITPKSKIKIEDEKRNPDPEKQAEDPPKMLRQNSLSQMFKRINKIGSYSENNSMKPEASDLSNLSIRKNKLNSDGIFCSIGIDNLNGMDTSSLSFNSFSKDSLSSRRNLQRKSPFTLKPMNLNSLFGSTGISSTSFNNVENIASNESPLYKIKGESEAGKLFSIIEDKKC